MLFAFFFFCSFNVNNHQEGIGRRDFVCHANTAPLYCLLYQTLGTNKLSIIVKVVFPFYKPAHFVTKLISTV